MLKSYVMVDTTRCLHSSLCENLLFCGQNIHRADYQLCFPSSSDALDFVLSILDIIMWFVKSENTERAIYFTPLCTNIVIGRKLDPDICNFSISDDASISRKHATLFLKDNCLVLQDLESTYGTYINESIETKQKIKSEDAIILKEGDLIKFGKLHSVWKVNKTDFVTCTSTLKGENLQPLKLILAKLGGVLKSDWDDSCCYLTMPAITLTIKVVLALVYGSHIVTPEFWSKCLEAVSSQTSLPNPKDYVPQVAESTLNKEIVSFLPDQKRRTLFQGKKVIFFSRRQMEMYKPILLASGASVSLINEMQTNKLSLCQNNIIVIQYVLNSISQESQVQQSKINDIVNYLKIKNKRVIPDAEIGLGILHCSLEKYCNPQFIFPSEVLRQSSPPDSSLKSSNILAQETQDILEKNVSSKRDEKIIEESLLSNEIEENMKEVKKPDVSLKRKLSNDSMVESSNAPKRHLTEGNDGLINQDDDIFNFIPQNNVTSNVTNERSEKTLDFLKPQKRKINNDITGDDDLFNFLPDQNTSAHTITKPLDDKESSDDMPQIKRLRLDTLRTNSVDISALRGIKLEHLKLDSTGWKSCSKIKKEDVSSDLESKINELDLGTTIVTIKKFEVPERNIFPSGDLSMNQIMNSKVQNFKKFKKVWPLKTQITVQS